MKPILRWLTPCRSDASRAKGDLDRFASERGLAVAAYYVENESGAKLHRPELFRLAPPHPASW